MISYPQRKNFETLEEYEDTVRAFEDALDAMEDKYIEKYYERD